MLYLSFWFFVYNCGKMYVLIKYVYNLHHDMPTKKNKN